MARKPPQSPAPAPGAIRARLTRPGIIAVGEWQAGRDYDISPAEFARLEPRGFVRVDPPAATADPEPTPAPETQSEE